MTNKFAAMVEAGNWSTFWVCTCCMLSHANGECCDRDTHGGDSCEPLSAVPATADISMGQRFEDHADDCLRRTMERGKVPDDYECECDVQSFSSSDCDGCGSALAGERHALFVVYDMREAS